MATIGRVLFWAVWILNRQTPLWGSILLMGTMSETLRILIPNFALSFHLHHTFFIYLIWSAFSNTHAYRNIVTHCFLSRQHCFYISTRRTFIIILASADLEFCYSGNNTWTMKDSFQRLLIFDVLYPSGSLIFQCFPFFISIIEAISYHASTPSISYLSI